MAVKLAVKVSGGEHVDAGVRATDVSTTVRGTEIGVAVANGTRLSARVESQPRMSMDSGAVQVMPSGEAFQGPYVLTPTLPGFDVETGGLFMKADIKVNPIPINEATNASNGYTVTIG